MRAFAYCDGEQIQIESFLTVAVLALLALALIDLGKSPASCSATCQSSDAGPLFKAIKKLLRGIWNRGWQSIGLTAALTRIFSTRPNLEGQKSRLITALQQIVCAIRTVMKDDIVKEGYACIGQYPLNFRTVMGRCTTQISLEEFTKMQDALPHFSDLFAKQGRLTEADMDAKAILSVNDAATRKVPKDQRVLHQERAILLTAADSIAKYRNYQREREMAPVLALERAAEKQRIRLEKEAKAEAAKAMQEAKRVAKAAEKARFDSLTAEEKKAEVAAKRRQQRASKARTDIIIAEVDKENGENFAEIPFEDFDDDLRLLAFDFETSECAFN
jgi:hypothetical protein